MNERIFGVFALRDRVADSFRSLMLDSNDATAKRNFAYAVSNSPELQFQSKDLELCRVGNFDSHSGVITAIVPIQVLCRGDEVINNASSN